MLCTVINYRTRQKRKEHRLLKRKRQILRELKEQQNLADWMAKA